MDLSLQINTGYNRLIMLNARRADGKRVSPPTWWRSTSLGTHTEPVAFLAAIVVVYALQGDMVLVPTIAVMADVGHSEIPVDELSPLSFVLYQNTADSNFFIGDDYTDFLFSEDMTLRLDITPSTTEHLSITWTELYTVLGDALLGAKRVETECSKPWRLARLLMLPEAEIVGVGVPCVEQGLYGSETVASDRDTREALCPEIVVCVGKEEYVLEEVSVEGFLGEKAFTTKGFRTISANADRPGSVDTCAPSAKVELDGGAVRDEAEAQDAEVEPQSVEEDLGEV